MLGSPGLRRSQIMAAAMSWIAAILLMAIFWGRNNEPSVGIILGLGFGQLTSIAVWFSLRSGPRRWTMGLGSALLVSCFTACIIPLFNSYIDATFYVVLIGISMTYTAATWATLEVVRHVSRVVIGIPEENPDEPRSNPQFGIREILLGMFVLSLLFGLLNLLMKSQVQGGVGVLRFLVIFSLIGTFYYFLAWPLVIACLAPRWPVALLLFSICVLFGIVLIQEPVFVRTLGGSPPPNPLSFFLALDLPFYLSVALHCLLARSFGYRLTAE